MMSHKLYDDVKETPIYTKEEIQAVVARLGAEISRDYEDKNPVMISVLRGAFVFMADLVRQVTVPCEIDFMAVSSYGAGTESSGRVKILKDLDTNIEGRHVIIVEDVLDSGITLSKLIEMLKGRGCASIAVCTMFDKPDRRKAQVEVAYNGLVIPNEFVVGYGLDYAEKYRNLPDLCVLKPEVYQK